MTSESSYKNGRLEITRIFDAPRDRVFDAWINTGKVQLWWGCGFATKVVSDIKACTGGKYEHLMTLNHGGDYLHHGLITEYRPPELLAYRLYDSIGDITMMVRVEFTAQGNKTRVHLTQDNLPDEYRALILAGWSAGFDKLNSLLIEEAR